jgi:hypothetical protein
MEPSKNERSAVLDLARCLHKDYTGRLLAEGEEPCQDVMWDLLEILEQSERGLIDLLNDYRSKAGQTD